MTGIKNLKVVKKLPDPLTAAERDRILAEMARLYDPRIVAYFHFAFGSGTRIRWRHSEPPGGTPLACSSGWTGKLAMASTRRVMKR